MRPPAVIFDVDGTLADVSGIRHYVMDNPRHRNFDKFHASAVFAPANEQVVDLARALSTSGFRVIVVTSRMEKWRYRTSAWLQKHNVGHDVLMMRPNRDGRPDVDVKRDILRRIRIRTRYRPILAVDDNPAVIRMWRSQGLPVVRVPGWTEETASR